MFFFFFQAEDGIRGGHVTGVQTCALPISFSPVARSEAAARNGCSEPCPARAVRRRSEERRVGEECRSRWSADHSKKKRLHCQSREYRHGEYNRRYGLLKLVSARR